VPLADVIELFLKLSIILMAAFQLETHTIRVGLLPDPHIGQNPIDKKIEAERVGRDGTLAATLTPVSGA
jgi:hypothetical protein